MDEVKKPGSHLTSPAAFVEGGIQDACDDACSICLEAFCESDPPTVTSCKHEFHLQCVLECYLETGEVIEQIYKGRQRGCQRSSNCPMCWQSISLKDQMSQELFEAVEQERSFRVNAERNASLIHLPELGNFELQHFPMDIDDPELEERIFQHLAVAASMGRAHHAGRRESSRNRSSTNDRRQFLVFPTHHNSSPTASVSPYPTGSTSDPAATTIVDSPLPISSGSSESPRQMPHLSSGSVLTPATTQGISTGDRSSSNLSLAPSQGRAGPSEFQSLSDSWKSRFSSLSMKYKESISKNTRGWKERLFSRSSSMPDAGSARRGGNPGIASLSHLMERLETQENSRAGSVSAVTNIVDSSHTLQRDHGNMGTHIGNGLNRNSTASAASSAQN